jgi:hypothetical protein
MATFALKPMPDGFGYIYGIHTADDGTTTRVDILPPLSDWRGDIKPGQIDPVQWILYADGVEIARVSRRDDIATAVAGKLPAP